MKALAIAATGMNAQQLNLEVIANNVANINTTGFKRARAEFADLLYQVERNSGRSQRLQPGDRSRRRAYRSRRADLGRAKPPHSG
jgi:flagellar hook-basal body protein